MPVNVKLLKKVRKLIAEEPRRLNMGHWGARYSPEEVKEWDKALNLPPCHTTACLAGHILLAAQPKKKWWELFNKDGEFKRENSVPVRAARLIGMRVHNCPFYEMEWGADEVLAWIDRQIDAASK